MWEGEGADECPWVGERAAVAAGLVHAFPAAGTRYIKIRQHASPSNVMVEPQLVTTYIVLVPTEDAVSQSTYSAVLWRWWRTRRGWRRSLSTRRRSLLVVVAVRVFFHILHRRISATTPLPVSSLRRLFVVLTVRADVHLRRRRWFLFSKHRERNASGKHCTIFLLCKHIYNILRQHAHG